MKTLLGATALCLATIAAAVTPASAQDINIYVQGNEGATVGPGPHSRDRSPHMRDRGSDEYTGRQMHHGHHGRHHRSEHKERWGHHSRGHGGKMHHGRSLDRMLDMIELYDQDGDDRVTQAEIDEFRAERLAAFDRDGDGMLSLEEYEALWLDAMRARMVDRFQAHDDDGDGQVTVEEFSRRTSRLVLRRDRNEDGALGLEDVRRDGRGQHRMQDRDDDE